MIEFNNPNKVTCKEINDDVLEIYKPASGATSKFETKAEIALLMIDQ